MAAPHASFRRGGGKEGALIGKDVVIVYALEGIAAVRALVRTGAVGRAALEAAARHLETIGRPHDDLCVLIGTLPVQGA